jgi:hypothetical protein
MALKCFRAQTEIQAEGVGLTVSHRWRGNRSAVSGRLRFGSGHIS